MAPQYAYYAKEMRLPLGSSVGLLAGGCPDSGVLPSVVPGGRFWFVYTALNKKVAPMAPKPGDVGSIEDVSAVLERIGRYASPHRRITGKNAGAVEFSLNSPAGTGPTASRCLGALPPQPSV